MDPLLEELALLDGRLRKLMLTGYGETVRLTLGGWIGVETPIAMRTLVDELRMRNYEVADLHEVKPKDTDDEPGASWLAWFNGLYGLCHKCGGKVRRHPKDNERQCECGGLAVIRLGLILLPFEAMERCTPDRYPPCERWVSFGGNEYPELQAPIPTKLYMYEIWEASPEHLIRYFGK